MISLICFFGSFLSSIRERRAKDSSEERNCDNIFLMSTIPKFKYSKGSIQSGESTKQNFYFGKGKVQKKKETKTKEM